MSTSARFAANFPKNKDNTSRVLTNDYQAPAYAATLNIVAKAANTVVKPATLTGGLTLNIAVGSSTTGPYVGDTIHFLFTGDATIRTITFGTGIAAGYASLALAVSKKGYASFMFDGAAWVTIAAVPQA